MHRSLWLISVLLVPLLAAAGNDSPGNCGQGSGGGNGCLDSAGSSTSSAASISSANSAATSLAASTSSSSATSSNTNRNQAIGQGGAGGAGGAGGQASATVSVGTGAQSQTMEGANNASQAQTVNVGGSSYTSITQRAASTAVAPAIQPTALCATSGSVGVQGFTFGLSAGRSVIDETCATIEAAKATFSLGKPEVAHEVLCGIPKVREARKRAGDPCAQDREDVKAAAVSGRSRPSATSDEPTDPFVRRRLGLPPLE